MTDTHTLHAIADRLRAATEPDRELDAGIAFAFQVRPETGTSLRDSFDAHEAQHDFATSWTAHNLWRDRWPIPHYTASLDACAALQAEALPGWIRNTTITEDLAFHAWAKRGVGNISTSHALETHAHLLAIVAAVIAEAESSDGDR